MLDSKKFIWIKGSKIKGLVWDLVVTGIKNMTQMQIRELEDYGECLLNIRRMYEIVVEKIFNKKNYDFFDVPPDNSKPHKNNKNNNKHY